MNDLISRQAAIDAVNSLTYPSSLMDVKRKLIELPPAQPEPSQVAKDIARILENGQDMRVIAQPEIIRCKDCDWWNKQEDSLQGRCSLMGMYPTGGWFCGNARRREVTT